MAVGGASALFLGLYGARETSRVVGSSVERWLGTPSLVGRNGRAGRGHILEVLLVDA